MTKVLKVSYAGKVFKFVFSHYLRPCDNNRKPKLDIKTIKNTKNTREATNAKRNNIYYI